MLLLVLPAANQGTKVLLGASTATFHDLPPCILHISICPLSAPAQMPLRLPIVLPRTN